MHRYGAIERVEAQADGTVRMHGIATTKAIDDQGKIAKAGDARGFARLCKDCSWATLEEDESEMLWCGTHPRSKFVPPLDYVTGKPVEPRQLSCYEARNFHNCGPQGRHYWEAR
jgi:hypothetical protein